MAPQISQTVRPFINDASLPLLGCVLLTVDCFETNEVLFAVFT